MQRIKLKPPQLSRAEFRRRADGFLKEVQEELMLVGRTLLVSCVGSMAAPRCG